MMMILWYVELQPKSVEDTNNDNNMAEKPKIERQVYRNL